MEISTIKDRLTQIAFKRSTAFCYSDYIKCPSGRCAKCGSDDLMRITADDGPEYGTEWIVEQILRSELTPVDLDEAFEESVRSCYPEQVCIGWMTLDAVSVMKAMDPVAWRCAQADWESEEESEGNIISLDGGATYYGVCEMESLLERGAA